MYAFLPSTSCVCKRGQPYNAFYGRPYASVFSCLLPFSPHDVIYQHDGKVTRRECNKMAH